MVLQLVELAMEGEISELMKLDYIDRKLIVWLISNDPDAVTIWIEQAVKEYRHTKRVEINGDQLMKEIGSRN